MQDFNLVFRCITVRLTAVFLKLIVLQMITYVLFIDAFNLLLIKIMSGILKSNYFAKTLQYSFILNIFVSCNLGKVRRG